MYGGALSDQDQYLGILGPNGRRAYAFDRVGKDLGRIGVEFGGAIEYANGVLVIVQDHDVHDPYCAFKRIAPAHQGDGVFSPKDRTLSTPASQRAWVG